MCDRPARRFVEVGHANGTQIGTVGRFGTSALYGLSATSTPPGPLATRGSMVPSAQGDARPGALVKIIPGELGYDLEPGDRTGDLDPPRQHPADRERVERAQSPPANGFQNRPCVCLCSAE